MSTCYSWKSLIGFMRFDLVEHFGGIQVLLLKNEGLTYQVISSVPQVLEANAAASILA